MSKFFKFNEIKEEQSENTFDILEMLEREKSGNIIDVKDLQPLNK